jgi:lysophospholipase L1-like esterase
MKKKHIIITAILALLIFFAAPFTISFIDKDEFAGNYRIPYPMGENYYLFSHYSSIAADSDKILFFGDSVIWGHYAEKDKTLTSRLNNLQKEKQFENMGIDGIHPAALYGLVKNFAGKIKNRDILVGVNLLWMSSPRHDLSGEANNEINHKKLLPQLSRNIPAYEAGIEERLSALINREFTFFAWVNHIKMSLFADSSFYRWTLDNPDKNILSFFGKKEMSYTVPEQMRIEGIPLQNISWVKPENSIQWNYMKKTLGLLKSRGNRVIAYITPYNIHSLTPESREKYFEIREILKKELEAEGIAVIAGVTPDKKYFADASHTGEEGYRILAEALLRNSLFNSLLR